MNAGSLLLSWLTLCVGCAQGYDSGASPAPVRDRSGLHAGQGGTMAEPGTATPAPDAGAANAPYTGEPCRMGETAPCACAPGMEGVKVCRYDGASPTKGTFSSCESCTATEPVDDPGDVMTSGGAGGGRAAGGSGAPSEAAGGGGSGGVRGGESGRSGSSDSPRGSSCMPACTNICFPVGILPCCTLLGTCGCTWAPGAYCL